MANDANSDIESAITRDGYPSLAAWTARNPDYDTFVFRRFDRLSARNLLHLESEVAELEAQLDRLDSLSLERVRLFPNDLDADAAIRDWHLFAERASNPKLLEHQRMVLVHQISAKLKEYHEALVLQAQIAAMDKPRDRALRVLKNFFYGDLVEDHRVRKPRPVLTGRSARRLDDKQELVAVRRPIDRDMLSRFLQDNWIFRTTRIVENRTEHIKERHITWTVAVIDTSIAAILLIGAIFSLYYTKRVATRLGLVAAFTAMFALSIMLLTTSRRADIFAATAAYAAVLVVFVSGNLGATP